MKNSSEIGSEFWDLPSIDQKNNSFDNAIWFISGRAALRGILQQIKKSRNSIKVAIPSFLCESMILPLEKENVEYRFYSVFYHKGRMVFDYSMVSDCNVILVLDYFGYEAPNDFPKDGKVIIRDLTHSLFIKKHYDADYYFGSLRKWAGFLTGGFAISKREKLSSPSSELNEYAALRSKAMSLKKEYLNGSINDKPFLEIFEKAEEMLNDCEMFKAESEDVRLANHFDIDFVRNRRRENANYLIKELNNYCLFKQLGQNDCPLCVPILIENRDKLRKHLINNGIYCPIHWPRPEVKEDYSDDLYAKELSLVCDQRYTLSDMKRIVEVVKDFVRREENA